MKKNAVLLGLIVAMIVALIFGVRHNESKKKAASESANRLFSFAKEDITGIEVSIPGETGYALKKDGRWKITKPFQDEVDEQSTTMFLETVLSRTRSETVFKENETFDLKPFGLEQPQMTVTLSAGPQKQELVIGSVKAFESDVYVYNKTKKDLAVTGDDWVAQLKKDPAELRDKRIWRVPDATAQDIRLKSDKFSWHIQKTGNQWSSTAAKVQLSQKKVQEYLTELHNMRARKTVAESKAEVATELEKTMSQPAFSVEIEQGAGPAHTFNVSFGKRAGADEAYLTSSMFAFVFEVFLSSAQALNKPISHFYDPKWPFAEIPIESVRSIHLIGSELQKDGEAWTLKNAQTGLTFRQKAVPEMLKKLTTLSARSYVDGPFKRGSEKISLKDQNNREVWGVQWDPPGPAPVGAVDQLVEVSVSPKNVTVVMALSDLLALRELVIAKPSGKKENNSVPGMALPEFKKEQKSPATENL